MKKVKDLKIENGILMVWSSELWSFCRVNGAGWGKGWGVLIKEMTRATH